MRPQRALNSQKQTLQRTKMEALHFLTWKHITKLHWSQVWCLHKDRHTDESNRPQSPGFMEYGKTKYGAATLNACVNIY